MPEFLQVTPAKTNEGFQALVSRDPRLGQVKIFDQAIDTHIAISESGHIAIYQPGGKKPARGVFKFEEVPETITVLHVSDITGFDLLIESKSGLGVVLGASNRGCMLRGF